MQVDALDAARAARWMRLGLANVVTEYPNKLDHVMAGPADVTAPRALHPVFYGSYDWHSAVHMHWLLCRLLRLHGGLAQAGEIRALFEIHFSPAAIAAECRYLERRQSAAFERTYGWAWLLKLATELAQLAQSEPQARSWAQALEPLAGAFVARFLEYLPRAEYPIRAGTHANSAFGLLFALDYAKAEQIDALAHLVRDKALSWFGNDRAYPARLEPSGSDFLSAGLQEALLLHEVLGSGDFTTWWMGFQPPPADLEVWLSPVRVGDRADPQIVHLDGLNLSRAWCWRRMHAALPEALQQPVQAAIGAHLQASLPHAEAGAYVGTHWLATFAALALDD